jgi:hypothetical protein
MKRVLLVLLMAVLLLPAASGCQAMRSNTGENRCGRPGCGGLLKNLLCCPPQRYPGGPESPTYGYPYYIIRGPRDFLIDNPPSIGP